MATFPTARVLFPPTGSTVIALTDIAVRVHAHDVSADLLEGVGFVARRLGGGGATVDSVVVRFPWRSDTTHQFALRVPDYPTNTQVDIYGIAFGAGGVTGLSTPIHIVVVQCAGVTCN